MIKRSPSRNQRSKGIKVKHVLQICVLVAVCFWLIYQVKHSHDKKKEFDKKDTKTSVKEQNDDGLKLGRKDLPRVQESSKNENHEEEEEGEDTAMEEEIKHEKDKEVRKPEEEDQEEEEHEEEENKNEDEEQEESNKHEEEQEEIASRHDDEEDQEEAARRHDEEEQEEAASRHEDEEQEEAAGKHEEEEQEEDRNNEEEQDEGRGDGDDEIDEQEQVKTEGEADHEDEEREREGEGDGKESRKNEGEHDHDGDENVHEAREENYKADDASSAVSHDNQIITTETEKASLEKSDENSERNVQEDANKLNKTVDINENQNDKESKLGGSEMAENGSPLNVTAFEEKNNNSRSFNPEDGLLLSASSNTTDAGGETGNNSTGLGTKVAGFSLQNETQTILASNQTQNATVDGATNRETTNLQTVELNQVNMSNTVSKSDPSDSNTTISTETVNADATNGDSFNNSKSADSENIMSVNATANGEVTYGASNLKETTDDAQKEKSNTDNESGGRNESQGSSSTNETVEVVKEDPIDSSDSSIFQYGNDARIDLDTLPDIRMDVGNSDDAGAE